MTINPAFGLGQQVYLKTDPDQHVRIVTRYIVSVNEVLYEVTTGLMPVTCQAIELSDTKDIVNYM